LQPICYDCITVELIGTQTEDTMGEYESLKKPEDMTLEEANAEYDRLYDFLCPSQADFVRMSACSRRINELKQEGK